MVVSDSCRDGPIIYKGIIMLLKTQTQYTGQPDIILLFPHTYSLCTNWQWTEQVEPQTHLLNINVCSRGQSRINGVWIQYCATKEPMTFPYSCEHDDRIGHI